MMTSQVQPPPLQDTTQSGEFFCPICLCKTADKHCVHYGGISCYSCRAFFRRAHQTTKRPAFVCKRNGTCEVTPKTRRKCQACRYQRCIRAGMDPDLVLSDEQKKVRFRNYIKKKAGRQHDHDDDDEDEEANNNNVNNDTTDDEMRRSSLTSSTSTTSSTASSPALSHLFGEDSEESSQMPVVVMTAPSPVMVTQNPPAVRSYPHVAAINMSSSSSSSLTLLNQRLVNNPVQEQVRQHRPLNPMVLPKREPPIRSRPYPALNVRRDILCHEQQSVNYAAVPVRPQPAPPVQEPPPTVVRNLDEEDDLESLESKIDRVQKRYFLSMAEIEISGEFVRRIGSFHTGSSTSAGREPEAIDLPVFAKHLGRLARQFQHFARMQPAFDRLPEEDKTVLLQSNTDLYVQYILARYFHSKNGEDQLRWLLDVNMPENLSSSGENRAHSFRAINGTLALFDDRSKESDEYDAFAGAVSSTGLVYHCTALVANLLLYHVRPNTALTSATSVNANFIEALEMLRQSHTVYGAVIKVEPILNMVKRLEKMSEMFDDCIRRRSSPRIVRPVYDLTWFRLGWGRHKLTKDMSGELVAHSLGVPVTPLLLPGLVNAIHERLKSATSLLAQFDRLTPDSKAALWSRNSLAMIALCLCKSEAAVNGCDQMRILSGNFADETWRGEVPHIDPEQMRRCSLIDMGRSLRRLSSHDLAAAVDLSTEIAEGVADDDAFMLLSAVVLFSGPEVELTPSVGVAADFYRKALILRLTQIGLGSFNIDKALCTLARMSFIVPKIQVKQQG